MSETLKMLRNASTKQELRDALARAHAFKMNPSTVGEVRAAKKLLHELEERDSRIRTLRDDLEQSLKLKMADALSVSIQRVQVEDEWIRDEIDLRMFKIELEKLRETEKHRVTIETNLRDAISMRSLLDLRRTLRRAKEVEGECDVDLMRQANEFLSVLEREHREQEVAMKGLKDSLCAGVEELRTAIRATRACFEFENLTSNECFQRAQERLHELEVEERRREVAIKEMRDAIDEVPPNHERLRHALDVAREAQLSATSCELMRRCESTYQRMEKDRENTDRSIKLLCEALKLKSFDVRKLEMLERAVEFAKESNLDRESSKILCDAQSSLNRLRWKRSIQQVINVRQIIKRKKNTVEEQSSTAANISQNEFERDLKDAESLKTIDARVAALREVLFENDNNKTTMSFRDALKRLEHYEHEIEVRDNLFAKLRGAMSTKNLELIELVLEDISKSGVHVDDSSMLQDAADSIDTVRDHL